ncbi:MAG: transglycosylase SLT domain-containing protein [Wenzhouxiangellaceae bacterium]|nr:transglycosylase SLT domain-containing protein [Wenzhouxiangellaceae bacterium]
MRFLASIPIFALLAWAPAPAEELAPAQQHPEARRVFIDAWQQAGRGNDEALREAIERIPDYRLTPYLRFEWLRQNLEQATGPEMERFLARYRNWSFAGSLERQWLRELARAGDDEALLRYGDNAREPEVVCRIERARIARDRTDGLAGRVRELWVSPVSQPRACDPLFKWWRNRGHPDADTAWQRFGMAIEAGELRLAGYLKRYLDPADRTLADGWIRMARRPLSGLNAATGWPDREQARRLVAWGLHRLAAQDWETAAEALARMRANFDFTDDEIGPAQRRIALFRAVDLDDGAVAAIDDLNARWLDQQILEWRLRAALANGQWNEVLASVRRMAPAEQLRERWRYWKARALEATGDPDANAVYVTLAAEADYYGFLAALRSGRPLTLCSREIDADGDVQRRLMRDAEFARAIELKQAGLDWHARWTWNRVSGRLSDRERRQAALLAAGIGWHDRAIAELGRARAFHAYPWRFPVVERERVVAESSRRGIEPVLVMGLMRAESAMQPDARSPAGARGLLQLMNGTARAVARRHGIEYDGPGDLYRPERNIALGVAHLAELAERFDGDWTRIAAAYNAGIRNAERWQRERADLPRDVWIETLPFFETRDYIPRVLAFATVYEWLLERPPRVLAASLLDTSNTSNTSAAFGCPEDGPVPGIAAR